MFSLNFYFLTVAYQENPLREKQHFSFGNLVLCPLYYILTTFLILELKQQLTILLYSSSSISFTFRQYDWKTKEIHTDILLTDIELVYQLYKWCHTAVSAVALPDIQTSHPGTCGWWALCLVWLCEGTCSDHEASVQQHMIGKRFDIKSDRH